MLVLILKFRLILMTIILIPQFTMIILAQQSSLMVQKDFNQVSAITFAVSIFLALSLPSLIIKMLVGNPLGKIKTFFFFF